MLDGDGALGACKDVALVVKTRKPRCYRDKTGRLRCPKKRRVSLGTTTRTGPRTGLPEIVQGDVDRIMRFVDKNLSCSSREEHDWGDPNPHAPATKKLYCWVQRRMTPVWRLRGRRPDGLPVHLRVLLGTNDVTYELFEGRRTPTRASVRPNAAITPHGYLVSDLSISLPTTPMVSFSREGIFTKAQLLEDVRSSVQHELTHALDPNVTSTVERGKYVQPQGEGGYCRYALQPIERRARLRQIYEDIWSRPWEETEVISRPTKLQSLKWIMSLPELDPQKPWTQQKEPRSVVLMRWLSKASPRFRQDADCWNPPFSPQPEMAREAQRDLFKMLSRLLDNAKDAGLTKVSR